MKSKMEKSKVSGAKNGDIWSNLLSDISSATPTRFSHKKSLVIFGDELSGKTTLATKLSREGGDDDDHNIHHGSGLDYHDVEVRGDEERTNDEDERTTLNVWVADGHLSHRNLIKFSLPSHMLDHSLILLVVDMSQPWNMLESLTKWVKVLHEHIDSLKVGPDEMKELRNKVLLNYQNYVDPNDKSAGDHVVDSTMEMMTLDENVLKDNLGLQIIVVCTKCDLIETLENEQDYKEEHFDYIQYQLRKFCMEIGAGLCYTSMKEDKNGEVLRKYILHQLYGFDFDQPASVVDRETVFVPAGWDTEKKINILSESFTGNISLDSTFESVITRPSMARKLVQDLKELIVDDEQGFLIKAQKLLQTKPTKQQYQSTLAGGDTVAYSKRPELPNQALMGKSKVEAGGNNERMLANFFNSLLMKKGPATPPQQGQGAATNATTAGSGKKE